MGLKTRKTDLTYLRIKDGKFYLASDKEFENPYDEVDGRIVDLVIKNDVFNGKPLEKLYVFLEDVSGVKYAVSFPFDSAYNTSFVSFIKNADLTKNVSLFLKQTDIKDSESKRTTFLISQDGKFLKAYYTKEDPKGMPPMVQKRNGKWDKDDMMDFIREVIETDLRPQVVGNKPMIEHEYDETVVPAKKIIPVSKTKNEVPWEEESSDDYDEDLPF